MKKLMILFCYGFVLGGCAFQGSGYNRKLVRTRLKSINDSSLFIDTARINRYRLNLKSLGSKHRVLDISDGKGIKLINESTPFPRKGFVEFASTFQIFIRNEDGVKISQTDISIYPPLRMSSWTLIDKYFVAMDEYYGNGRIKSRRILSKFNFEIGSKYEYDQDGNVVSVVDTDDGFKFDYEDVMKFYIRKWKSLDYEGFPVKIIKGYLPEDPAKKTWILSHRLEDGTGLSELYFLDALDGKVLKIIKKDERARP